MNLTDQNQMIASRPGTLAVLAALFVGLLGTPYGAAYAATAGRITHLSGTLSAQRADGTKLLLAVKSEINEGDILDTQAETYARIKFNDGGEVVMRPGTQLKINSYAYHPAKPESDNVLISMFKGGMRAVTGLIGKRNREKVGFQTETATIGIRGTNIGIQVVLAPESPSFVPESPNPAPSGGGGQPGGPNPVLPPGTYLDVASGIAVITTPAGSLVVNSGGFGYASGPNVPPIPLPPGQGVPVTMPNAIAVNTGTGQPLGSSSSNTCKMR